ncbi:MAG: winged helix-turn-helix domain-containing protein, partial [Gaiellaceae bacterium]
MRWTFLTNHARALLCIAEDPQVRLRVIAQQIGITERAAQSLVNDLVDAGYVWLVTRLDPAAEAGAERREVMSDRQVLRGLADVAIASPWFAFAPFYRRRHLRW